jgi:hypothetical protein
MNVFLIGLYYTETSIDQEDPLSRTPHLPLIPHPSPQKLAACADVSMTGSRAADLLLSVLIQAPSGVLRKGAGAQWQQSRGVTVAATVTRIVMPCSKAAS